MMTGDEYIELLHRRQREWDDQHRNGPRPRYGSLLEWFIEPGDEDEDLVELPEPTSRPAEPAAPKRVRPPVNLDVLIARRDRLVARRDAITGDGPQDPAIVNLSPSSRSRAAARAGRRRFEQMDRDLERFTALTRQIEQLNNRIRMAGLTNSVGPGDG